MWIVLGLAVAGLAVAWYASHLPATPPAADTPAASAPREAPLSANETAASTERRGDDSAASRTTAPGGRATPLPRPAPTTAPPAVAPRELRVTADVDGAYVFLDRKFLGSTPLVSRDVAPGTYQLNVQVEGRAPVVQRIEVLAAGPTEVSITLPPPGKSAAAGTGPDASVAVVHKHAMGECEGTLRATPDGFRYETPHKDAFTLPYASVETFSVDYADKRLRLKQRGGRTWNFTTRAASADPLFVFHRDVQAARP